MGVDDAIRAADFVGCTKVLGMRFDTFPPIKIDHKAAIAKFAAKGKKLHLLKPGENRTISELRIARNEKASARNGIAGPGWSQLTLSLSMGRSMP